eukprot:scaffold6470_cov59-Skeletonema_dohrnii-CCMP3373.AAC.1
MACLIISFGSSCNNWVVAVILEVKSSLSLMRFPDMAVANDVDVISSIFLLLYIFFVSSAFVL